MNQKKFVQTNFKDLKLVTKDSESLVNITDIRNKTHLFDDKFRKKFLLLGEIDNVQSDFFLSHTKWWIKPIVKRFNFYDNLGVYFNIDGKIVSNTHYIAYLYGMDNWEDIKNEVFKYGLDTINSMKDVLKLFDMNVEDLWIKKEVSFLKWGYQDYNTNNEKIFPKGQNKYIELFFLHLISIINFVLYEITKIIYNNPELLMRIRYIACHYTQKSLEKLINQVKNGTYILNVSSIEDEVSNNEIFNSSFRNCMSHYSFVNSDKTEIDKKLYNYKLPFFGLIETKFGMTFEDYNLKLMNKLKLQSNMLLEYININTNNIEFLD